jgi:MoxR-like ATPase
MKYLKMFDIATGIARMYNRSGPARMADHTRIPVYEYTPEIELAVNVALATGRPLLIRGDSGSGKSSLARAVAHKMGWRFYEIIVTSRTNAQDLLWTFDSIRRLNDAQAKDLKDESHYIKPGIMWWAFDRDSARKFDSEEAFSPQTDSPDSVILIDEIDKAEPDIPNNLLLPIGSLRFFVDEIGQEISAPEEHPPLIFITTNEERQLPSAFLRRCVVLKLNSPDAERLKKIAIKHFGERDDALYVELAKQIIDAAERGERPKANSAEFLDAVWACISMHVRPPINGENPSKDWELVKEATLIKPNETSL